MMLDAMKGNLKAGASKLTDNEGVTSKHSGRTIKAPLHFSSAVPVLRPGPSNGDRGRRGGKRGRGMLRGAGGRGSVLHPGEDGEYCNGDEDEEEEEVDNTYESSGGEDEDQGQNFRAQNQQPSCSTQKQNHPLTATTPGGHHRNVVASTTPLGRTHDNRVHNQNVEADDVVRGQQQRSINEVGSRHSEQHNPTFASSRGCSSSTVQLNSSSTPRGGHSHFSASAFQARKEEGSLQVRHGSENPSVGLQSPMGSKESSGHGFGSVSGVISTDGDRYFNQAELGKTHVSLFSKSLSSHSGWDSSDAVDSEENDESSKSPRFPALNTPSIKRKAMLQSSLSTMDSGELTIGDFSDFAYQSCESQKKFFAN
jgi:hypothetical protein